MEKMDLGTQIYQEWKKVCVENNALSEEYLKLTFWKSLNLPYLRDLNTRREVAHQKWVLLWDLLVKNDLVVARPGKALTPTDFEYLPKEG